ncbi:MAG: hypothetical protein A3K67_08165 [Euryarchaeota archaeon RBG_16_62_10]|nr:MAG: hypothetical protein A3K67_08165 [Euryarchaeota archaeon RBG_16_62_10]
MAEPRIGEEYARRIWSAVIAGCVAVLLFFVFLVGGQIAYAFVAFSIGVVALSIAYALYSESRARRIELPPLSTEMSLEEVLVEKRRLDTERPRNRWPPAR